MDPILKLVGLYIFRIHLTNATKCNYRAAQWFSSPFLRTKFGLTGLDFRPPPSRNATDRSVTGALRGEWNWHLVMFSLFFRASLKNLAELSVKIYRIGGCI